MPSLIHELDNDGLLLMYLAGELPADDRAEVEQSLAADPGLRAALAAVDRDVAAGEAALAAADRIDPPAASPSARSVALRQVSRAVRQWQVDRFVAARAPAAAAGGGRPRFPAWAYPAAAAVVVVIGALGWWGVQAQTGTSLPAGKVARGSGDGQFVDGLTDADHPFDAAHLPLVAEAFGAYANPMAADGTGGVAEAERQARTLARADDLSVTSTVVGDGLNE